MVPGLLPDATTHHTDGPGKGSVLQVTSRHPRRRLVEGFEKLGASPMPPMQILLKPQELADVMEYVMTLK